MHCFFCGEQLCRGATEEERALYGIPCSPESFAYLKQSGCTSIEGVDDAAEFGHVKHAMAAVGIDAQAQVLSGSTSPPLSQLTRGRVTGNSSPNTHPQL
jgi:myosin heavy subunit